ncbi:MAG TPA: hypothetical protein VHA75_17595, partial [Rugosimonospora sp.]|nr:hypothetical protein [Rugosimonospora sp.]
MFGRTRAKTHAELMRSELNDSLDHFMQAANHGASAFGAAAGPRWESAKAAVGPRMDQARGLASTGWSSTKLRTGAMRDAARSGALQAQGKASKMSAKAKARAAKKVGTKQSGGSGRKKIVGLLVIGGAAGAGTRRVPALDHEVV